MFSCLIPTSRLPCTYEKKNSFHLQFLLAYNWTLEIRFILFGGLFYVAMSISDHTAPNGRVFGLIIKWNECGRRPSWPWSRYYPPEGRRKTANILSQDITCPGLNLGTLKTILENFRQTNLIGKIPSDRTLRMPTVTTKKH
jgi:hypothetical protein